MAQFLRPDSNVTQTSFTGGFAEIDEVTSSDTDFAYGANNTAAVLEVGLSNPSATPSVGTTTVRYRIAKTNAGTVDGGGNAVTVTPEVYQGTVLIASGTAQTATGTWTQYTFTPDMSSVTDWNDLRLRFTTSASGGSPANRRGGAVSWAELEAPDGAAITGTLSKTLDAVTSSSVADLHVKGAVSKTLDALTASSAGTEVGMGESIALTANGAGITATLNNGVYTITTTASSVAGSSFVGSAEDAIHGNYVAEYEIITHANGAWGGLDNAAPAAWGYANIDETFMPDAGFGAGKANYVKNGTFTVQDVAFTGPRLFMERVGTTIKFFQGQDWPTASAGSPIITSTAVDATDRAFQFGIDSSGLVSQWKVRVVPHPSNKEGTLSKTLGSLIVSSTGAATTAISGTVNKTLGALTASSAGKVQLKGTTSKTLDAVTSASAGKVALKGTVTKTLDAVTSTSAGKVQLKGITSATLGAVTSSSQSAVALKGTFSKTLGDVTSSSSADLVIKGTASATFGAVTVSSTGGVPVPIVGTLNKTLGSLASTSSADLVVKGSLSKTLGSLTVTSFIKPFTVGRVTKTLEGVTSNSGSKIKVTASVAKTLEGVVAGTGGSAVGGGSSPPVVLPPSTSVSLRRHELRGDPINAYKAYKIIARSKRGH